MDSSGFDAWLNEHKNEKLDVPVLIESYTLKNVPEIGRGKWALIQQNMESIGENADNSKWSILFTANVRNLPPLISDQVFR